MRSQLPLYNTLPLKISTHILVVPRFSGTFPVFIPPPLVILVQSAGRPNTCLDLRMPNPAAGILPLCRIQPAPPRPPDTRSPPRLPWSKAIRHASSLPRESHSL